MPLTDLKSDSALPAAQIRLNCPCIQSNTGAAEVYALISAAEDVSVCGESDACWLKIKYNRNKKIHQL